MPENDGKIIHSVAKAITLLDILTHRAQPVALTELYRETGWPKSTIHGLLSTMRASGLIEQGADAGATQRAYHDAHFSSGNESVPPHFSL